MEVSIHRQERVTGHQACYIGRGHKKATTPVLPDVTTNEQAKKHKQPQVVGHVRQVTPVPLVRQGDVEFLTAVPGIVVGFVHKIFQEFPCEEQLDET